MPAAGVGNPRDPLIDGLRGLALGGVLVVNTLSYPHVFSSPVGIADPPGSPLALAVLAFCTAVFQAKSYPLLMFLVGYAWAMRTRRRGRSPMPDMAGVRRWQMARQAMLGVVHGNFVYFGDILSWLALLGLLLVGTTRRRSSSLRRHCLGWFGLWLTVGGATWFWTLLLTPSLPSAGHWMTAARTWSEVFALQRSAYASYLFQVPWQMPMMLALGTLGVLAGRLRVLEKARIGASVQAFGIRVLLPLGLVLNGVLALWMVRLQRLGDTAPADLASQFAGPVLAAGVVCALARSWARGNVRWLAAFAPLGRLTMSAYVGHTLCCLILFAGAAAALGPAFGTVGLFAFGLAYWLVALALAPLWLAGAAAGPLERWVRGTSGERRSSRRNTIT